MLGFLKNAGKEMIETWKAWVMLAFGVLVGVVVTYIFPWPIWFKPSPKDWIEAVSAIGTVAAVIVAIGIALRDSYRRNRESQQRAILVAARLGPEFQRSIDEVMSLFAKLEFTHLSTGEMLEHADFVACLHQLRVPLIGAHDLDSLAALPKNAAYRLARALAILDYEFSCLVDRHRNHREGDMHVVSDEEVEDVRSRLLPPLDMLRLAVQEMERAARPLVARPEPEEMYVE